MEPDPPQQCRQRVRAPRAKTTDKLGHEEISTTPKTVTVKAGHSYLARAQRAASKAKRR